jgi:hypothetical protein
VNLWGNVEPAGAEATQSGVGSRGEDAADAIERASKKLRLTDRKAINLGVNAFDSCVRPGVAFMLALGPIVCATALIVIRFELIRHSIGGVTAPIARIMPAIATVPSRVVPIMAPHRWRSPGIRD